MGRQEKDDVLNLTLAVGDILEDRGFDVFFTRTEDVYNTPYEKAVLANESGADLFISIHRNSGEVPGMYNGVQSLIYNEGGIKQEIAENINKNLVALGFDDKGVIERPNLVVLKRTNMPAVLVEAGFINSDIDNELFDEKFDDIALAIADGITDTLSGTAEQTLYKVQVGEFENRQLAESLAAQLESQGFPAYVEYTGGTYKVISGVFSQVDNAVAMAASLRAAGYDTFITM